MLFYRLACLIFYLSYKRPFLCAFWLGLSRIDFWWDSSLGCFSSLDSSSIYSSSTNGARFVSKVKRDFDVWVVVCSWRFRDPKKLVYGDWVVQQVVYCIKDSTSMLNNSDTDLRWNLCCFSGSRPLPVGLAATLQLPRLLPASTDPPRRSHTSEASSRTGHVSATRTDVASGTAPSYELAGTPPTAANRCRTLTASGALRARRPHTRRQA